MSLKTFTAAYVEAALWSSTDNADDSGGEPLDKNYDASDIVPETQAIMRHDARDFYTRREQLWRSAGMSDEQAGHDFWLTRNGHGAGFWDRGLGVVGEKLTDEAKLYGSFDLYVGDDGKVHGS